MSISSPIKDIKEINMIKDYYEKHGLLNNLLMFSLAINTGADLKRLLNLKVKDVRDRDYFICDKQKIIPLSKELKDKIKLVTSQKNDNDLLFSNSNIWANIY